MSLLSPILRPRNEAPVPYVGRRGSGTTFGGTSRSTGPLGKMGQVGTLFAIVNRTSTATAAVDWHLYRKPAPGRQVADHEREQVAGHAALALWNTPNPFMTQADLIEAGQQHVDLAGETFLIVVRKGNIPVELWPVRPDRMDPVKHPTEFLTGWTYKGPDGEKIPLGVDEVIQLKMPNPEDPYRGMGPVQAILVELDAATAAAAWNAAFFRNSAEPGGVIQLENRLSDDEWDEFTQRWAEQHRGVSNAHRVAVIEHGAKWVDRKYTQRDMQFVELRNIGRDVLMEAYGISRATLGVTDGVNFAAAKAADAQFAKLLTVPRLERWKQALNVRLLPMFGATGKQVEFDYESPVTSDEEAENAERDSKVAAVIALSGAGWDPTDAAEKYGLPAIQYGVSGTDPDRDLMVKLVTAAPAALGPLLLPILLPNVDFPASPETAPEPSPAPHGGTAGPGQGEPTAHAHVRAEAEDGAPDVDLTAVQEAWRAALDRLLDTWVGITAAQRTQLRGQIVDAIDDGDLAALAALHADSDLAAERLTEALEALARAAAAQVVTEAAAQEVELTAAAPAAGLGAVAATVAALLAADLALAAGREALRIWTPGATGAAVAGAVDAELRERSTASTEAALGGALTGAQNRARVDTMADGPLGSLYASEAMDSSTCSACAAIDGRFICNTDDLGPHDKLYTALGGYVHCEGGVRCRGCTVGVWRPKTVDEGGDS